VQQQSWKYIPFIDQSGDAANKKIMRSPFGETKLYLLAASEREESEANA